MNADNQAGKGAGHRRRLREKFLEFGLDKFTDDEIVELLLTLATPRKDCKQAARDALNQFGGLSGVLEASIDDLQKINGIGPSNAFGVRLIQSIARKFLRERIIREDYLNSFSDALDYFMHTMRGERNECFHILYLNSQNAILHEERLTTGTASSVALHPRQVIEKALAHAAVSIVIAHNHPGGDPTPSKQDINLTRQLYVAGRFSDLWLRDHLIIATNDYFSFANDGLIKQFENEFDKLSKKMWK